jgi:hypothetical protein
MAQYDITHKVISMRGRLRILSAESREFSTSSRMDVYKHFPAYSTRQVCRSGEVLGGKLGRLYIVKACDVLVLCKEFSWALLLELI